MYLLKQSCWLLYADAGVLSARKWGMERGLVSPPKFLTKLLALIHILFLFVP